MGCHFLLQGMVPTQGSKLCLFHLLDWQVDSLPPSHPSLRLARAAPASPSSVRRNMQGPLFFLWAPGPGFPISLPSSYYLSELFVVAICNIFRVYGMDHAKSEEENSRHRVFQKSVAFLTTKSSKNEAEPTQGASLLRGQAEAAPRTGCWTAFIAADEEDSWWKGGVSWLVRCHRGYFTYYGVRELAKVDQEAHGSSCRGAQLTLETCPVTLV